MTATDVREVDLAQFRALTGCDVEAMPGNVGLVARLGGRWVAVPAVGLVPQVERRRFELLLRFLDRYLPDEFPEGAWSLVCTADGWRERRMPSEDYRWVEPVAAKLGEEWWGGPGEVPLLSPTRPGVLCFAAHVGDPSAVLVPEGHYLADAYRHVVARTRLADRSWRRKDPGCIFAGSNHGDPTNTPGLSHPTSRQMLADHVRDHGIPIEVRLGISATRREQLRRRFLIDIDGMTRTWDAYAWKMASRSLLLAVDSAWETLFSTAFEPWEHYVPVARDLHDLADALEWCLANDAAAEAIARQGAARAAAVYRWTGAADLARPNLRRHLAAPGPTRS